MMIFMLKFAPETFRTVEEELVLFGGAVLLGIPAGLGFDVMRLFRRLLPHRNWIVAVEDILILILMTFLLLCYASAFAGGDFRIYYVIACLTGFVLYECTLGMILMRCCDIILAPVRKAGKRIAWICEKLRCKFVKCAKKSEHVQKNTKNNLQHPPHRVYNKNSLRRKAGGRHGRQKKI